MTDLDEKVDELFNKKKKNKEFYRSPEAQRVYDNLDFADEYEENPIKSKEFDKTIFGYEVISFNHYINQRLWPRSIYVTDKLTRLAMSAKLEFLKRYLSKKRAVPMKMIWLLLLMFIAIIVVILFIMFILPQMGGIGHGGLM